MVSLILSKFHIVLTGGCFGAVGWSSGLGLQQLTGSV